MPECADPWNFDLKQYDEDERFGEGRRAIG
jgi:hypothetical protein